MSGSSLFGPFVTPQYSSRIKVLMWFPLEKVFSPALPIIISYNSESYQTSTVAIQLHDE